MKLPNGNKGVVGEAYDAAGGDPLLALLLVLDLIWAGTIRVGPGRPISIIASDERIAA